MKAGLCFLLLIELCVEASVSSTQGTPPNKESEGHFPPSSPAPRDAAQKPSLAHKAQEELTIYNLTAKSTDFGFNLYRTIADKHDENIFISPLSITFALASLMLGTRGLTYSEILQGLNLHLFNDTDKPHLLPSLFRKLKDNITRNEDFVLEQGSFSFIHQDFPIKDAFLNLTQRYFDMEFSNLDFQNASNTKKIINSYITKKTKGKISNLFDEIDPQTKLILADYIQFKGKWLYPFNPAFTELDTFYVSKYHSVKVPMMFKTDKISSTFDETYQCKVVKLPYRGGASMLIIMPQRESDYASIEDHLSAELVEKWLANMKHRKMEVFFPKFKLDQKYKMHKFLQDLGINQIFSGKANLSGLTDERNLKLTQVTQRAVIEVDEKGTEAAAVTVSEITAYSMPPIFRVDHPFLMAIYEESHKIMLFVGRVTDPTKF
ncbi:protein Z-dependent protease inhibitor [Rhinatrema bivittatum]|uniref:protein Z-dependent protease inhibitor n=1 Tax=Rhinatrema bivittatum TaxID=194408 RepID=UPI0011262F3C|nr:protein Z-dependent protease inhibitor [Rhinatrema bivittatum]